MPIPTIGEVFKPFTDRLDGLIGSLKSFVYQFYQDCQDILAIKSVFHEELQNLIKEFEEFTKEQKDFADRVKNLKSHVIRADIIFEFIHDIQTGDLKRWLQDEIQDLRSQFDTTGSELQQAFDAFTAKGLNSSPGSIALQILQKIKKGWTLITLCVHAIRALTPIFKKLADKLEHYEDSIMPQNSERTKATLTYFKRPSTRRRG